MIKDKYSMKTHNDFVFIEFNLVEEISRLLRKCRRTKRTKKKRKQAGVKGDIYGRIRK